MTPWGLLPRRIFQHDGYVNALLAAMAIRFGLLGFADVEGVL